MRQLTLAAVFGLMAAAGGARAASVLDQNNPIQPLYTSLANTYEFQQVVTDGVSGTLAGIELYAVVSPAFSDTVSIVVGGQTLFTGTASFAATNSASPFYTGTFIDTSAAGISLTAGETFVIDVAGAGGSGTGQWGASTAAYAGGGLTEIVSGTPIGPPPSIKSLAFESYVTPVPLPAGLPLLFSGMAGLGLAVGRRRRV